MPTNTSRQHVLRNFVCVSFDDVNAGIANVLKMEATSIAAFKDNRIENGDSTH